MEKPFVIEPKTRSRLARDYGVCLPTFNKWLKPIVSKLGEIRSRTLTTLQVRIIVKFLGLPKHPVTSFEMR